MTAASDSMPEYPWYCAVTDGSLEQGDLLDDFPFASLAPPYEVPLNLDDPPIRVGTAPIIVLTQSCDLDATKIENVLICPHFLPNELAEQIEEMATSRGRERIRQGTRISLYSLPPCRLPGQEMPTRNVNFRQLTTVPFGLVTAVAKYQGDRIRLLPPYREHLAQALARFLGRVGLPTDYPSF